MGKEVRRRKESYFLGSVELIAGNVLVVYTGGLGASLVRDLRE